MGLDMSKFNQDDTLDGTANPSGVMIFYSSSKWQQYLQKMGACDLLVVYFTATWCGPCKMMEPVFNQFASTYTKEHVAFAKIDVDRASDAAKQHRVAQMPTFVLFKFGEEVDRLIGANKEGLESKIQEHHSK